MHDKILILDFGSQVTQLIARRVREARVYCEVHPADVSDEFVRGFGARGVCCSVTEAGPPERMIALGSKALSLASSSALNGWISQ